MPHQTRVTRRQIFRVPYERYAWSGVRRSQVRCVLRALESLYRRAGL